MAKEVPVIKISTIAVILYQKWRHTPSKLENDITFRVAL